MYILYIYIYVSIIYIYIYNIYIYIFLYTYTGIHILTGRQLRMTFFHKTMVAEKYFFPQMNNTSLQRVNYFLNVKMINHEQIK